MLRLKSFGKYLGEVYPLGILGMDIRSTALFCWVSSDFFYSFVFFLKKHSLSKFESLLDVWGVDYIHMRRRFEVNYLLTSLRFNLRLILKVRLMEPRIRSLSRMYYSSIWLERETWDMFGIFFVEHSDLRRILTDYGFGGFPLRKDFPLTGFNECIYGDGEKRVIYVPLRLMQEFRNFGIRNRWIAF